MPTRSITDEEIGFIKSMLARGMRNRDIQFYFNRQDRPVNSGRISQIRKGSYGGNVPVAADTDLDAFLAKFTPAEVGVVVGAAAQPARQTLADQTRERFVQQDDGHWYLSSGETVDQECKKTFDPQRLTPIIRAIAALANNRGGFIFIGVRNEECRVIGLSDSSFQETDIATIVDKVKTYLTPTPTFSKYTISLGTLQVGVIQVEKHSHPPVIVCRDGDKLEDGTILFRYPGQSGRIKYGDLLNILHERDRSAQDTLLLGATRLSEIGTDRALIVDTLARTIESGEKKITIDHDLANKISFIREGEFEEREGAPTLRLIGDASLTNFPDKLEKIAEGRVLTPDMVIKSFLNKEKIQNPLEHIKVSAHFQRQWLPIYYFAYLSGKSINDVIGVLRDTRASYRKSKQAVIERLKGKRKAYLNPTGVSAEIMQDILSEKTEGIINRYEPSLIARALQGIPDDFKNTTFVFKTLDELHEVSLKRLEVRGTVYRAISRLDEIEYLNRCSIT